MRFLPFATALLGFAACTSIQSSNIKTAGMSATMRVVADGGGSTKVTTQLNVDSNGTDFVDLSGGDTLTASAAAQSQTMSRTSLLGTVSYEATFSGDDAEGTRFTIALTRPNDVSAPSSTCVMPKPFNITMPTANGVFSRGNSDIAVVYDGSGTQDPMTWTANGNCVVNGPVTGQVSGDPGSFTIAKGALNPNGSQSSLTCPVQITLTRTRTGQLDSHFGSGGSISAQQVRTLTFSSMP
jgi:hypothetical protein